VELIGGAAAQLKSRSGGCSRTLQYNPSHVLGDDPTARYKKQLGSTSASVCATQLLLCLSAA
jgi:hypothetical protein